MISSTYKIGRLQYITGLLIFFWIFCLPVIIVAQTQNQPDEENAEQEVAPEDEGSIETRMSFEIFKINKDILLKAIIRQKMDEKFLALPGQVVIFYGGDDKILGQDTTKSNGLANFSIKADQKQAEIVTFTAKLLPSKYVSDTIEEQIDLLPSSLTLELSEEDSIRIITIKIGQPSTDGTILPLADKECRLYVKRLFGYLPLSEDVLTSDESGIITMELPNNIKGDTAGNIIIVARILEDETLGNVESSQEINWGLPLSKSDFYTKRQLWSARSNAPISLIIVVNAMLIIIWSVMFYVIYKMFYINKIGKKQLVS